MCRMSNSALLTEGNIQDEPLGTKINNSRSAQSWIDSVTNLLIDSFTVPVVDSIIHGLSNRLSDGFSNRCSTGRSTGRNDGPHPEADASEINNLGSVSQECGYPSLYVYPLATSIF